MLVYSKCGKITIEFNETVVLRVILCLLSHCKRKKTRKYLENGRLAPQQSSSRTAARR